MEIKARRRQNIPLLFIQVDFTTSPDMGDRGGFSVGDVAETR